MTNSKAIYKCLENSVSETAVPIKLFSVDDSKGFCIEIFLNITYSSTASFADLMFMNNATDASFKFGYCPYAKIENGYSIEIWKTTSSNITTYYAALAASSALATALGATWNIRKELKYGNYTELYSSAESVIIPASTDADTTAYNTLSTLSGSNKNFIMNSDLNVTNVKATGDISANNITATGKLTAGTNTAIDGTGISTNKITNSGALENTGSLTVGTSTNNSSLENTINGSLTVGNGLTSTANTNYLGTINLSGDITPTTSNSLDLGKSDLLFKSAFINNLTGVGTGSITGYDSATIGTLNINGQLNLKNSIAEAISNSATSSTTNFIKFTGGNNYSTDSSNPTQINLSDFFTLGNNGKYDCLSFESEKAVSISSIKRNSDDKTAFFKSNHIYLIIPQQPAGNLSPLNYGKCGYGPALAFYNGTALYCGSNSFTELPATGTSNQLGASTFINSGYYYSATDLTTSTTYASYVNSTSGGVLTTNGTTTTLNTAYVGGTAVNSITARSFKDAYCCVLFIDLGSIGTCTSGITMQSTYYKKVGLNTTNVTVDGYSQMITNYENNVPTSISVIEHQGTVSSYTLDSSITSLKEVGSVHNITSISSSTNTLST